MWGSTTVSAMLRSALGVERTAAGSASSGALSAAAGAEGDGIDDDGEPSAMTASPRPSDENLRDSHNLRTGRTDDGFLASRETTMATSKGSLQKVSAGVINNNNADKQQASQQAAERDEDAVAAAIIAELAIPPADIHLDAVISREGAHGEVWEARLKDERSGKEKKVAVKRLPSDQLAKDDARRLKREVSIFASIAQLCHRHVNKTRKNHNVCKLYGVCEEPGFLSIVMRMYKTSVQRLVKRLPKPKDGVASLPRLPCATIARIGRDIANGCKALHEAGVVVADLKPANVLIDEFGNGVVADFGMSVVVNDGGSHAPASIARGTPNYMSPESWNAEAEGLSRRSDVWSLGATLLFMVTGDPPFKGYTMTQLFAAVFARAETPEIPEGVNLPERLRTLIEKCFAYEPKDRPSMEVCLDELNALMAELALAEEEERKKKKEEEKEEAEENDEEKEEQKEDGDEKQGKHVTFAPPPEPQGKQREQDEGAKDGDEDAASESILALLGKLESVENDSQMFELMLAVAERCVRGLAAASSSDCHSAETARMGLRKLTEALKVLLSALGDSDAEALCLTIAEMAITLPPLEISSPNQAAEAAEAVEATEKTPSHTPRSQTWREQPEAALALCESGVVPLLASLLSSDKSRPGQRVASAIALQRIAVLLCDDPIALLSSVPVHRVVPMVRKLSAASSSTVEAAMAAADAENSAGGVTDSPESPLNSPTGAFRLTLAARRSLLDDFEASRGDEGDGSPFCASEALQWLFEKEGVLMSKVLKWEFEDAFLRAGASVDGTSSLSLSSLSLSSVE